jgi:hypothetical protein
LSSCLPLPRALGIAEVHRDVGGHREGVARDHFMRPVLDQRLAELRQKLLQKTLEPLHHVVG